MNILFVLIPLSLVLLGMSVWSLFWAIDTGQFENLDEAARGYERRGPVRKRALDKPSRSSVRQRHWRREQLNATPLRLHAAS